MADARVVTITAISWDELDGTWEVLVQDRETIWECTLKDPACTLQKCSDEQLEWVFNTFPRYYSHESSKAQAISSEILAYAKMLEKQLQLPNQLVYHSLGEEDNLNVILEIHDSEEEISFQGLLWESLECLQTEGQINYQILRAYTPSSIQIDSQSHAEEFVCMMKEHDHEPAIKTTFNILFVVSRPNGAADVDHHLACRTVFDILLSPDLPPEQAAKVKLEVARPGTWSAFKSHISSATRSWHKRCGKGPWYDIVHFDVHGMVGPAPNFDSNLIFDTSTGKEVCHVSGHEIGELLQANWITTVILNSCESTKFNMGQSNSNLAKVLMGYGIHTIVGMRFSLVSRAASVFLKALYKTYLTSDASISESVHIARRKLCEDRSRPANVGVTVELPDFIIPIVYESTVGNKSTPFHLNLPTPSKDAIQRLCYLRKLMTKHQKTGNIIGRTYEVMELEKMLFDGEGRQIIQLSGMRGSGKTMFGLWLMLWWVGTGLAEDCWHWSDKPRDAKEDLRVKLRSCDDSFIQELRERRHIIFIDVYDPFSTAEQSKVDNNKVDNSKLEDFLRKLQLRKNRSIVIMVSRLRWPSLSEFKLQSLSHVHCLSIINEILSRSKKGHERVLLDPKQSNYFRNWINRLYGNPAAVIAFTRAMPINFIDNSPKPNPHQAFDQLLCETLDIEQHPEQFVLDCVTFVDKVHLSSNIHNVNERTALLILLGLSIPTNTFSSAFFDFLAERINTSAPANPLIEATTIRGFVEQEFITSEWIQELRPEAREKHSFYVIHPILTNILRCKLKRRLPDDDHRDLANLTEWLRYSVAFFYVNHVALDVVEKFRAQQSLRGAETPARNTMISDLGSRVNCMNYLAMMEFLKQNPRIHTPIRICDRVLICCRELWNTLGGQNENVHHRSSHIPLDLAVNAIKFGIDLFDELSPAEKAMNPTEILYWSLCESLAFHDVSKDNEEQLLYLRRALQVARSVLTRKKKFTILDLQYTVKELIMLGSTHIIKLRHLPQAKVAFLVSALLARVCMSGDAMITLNAENYRFYITNIRDNLRIVAIGNSEPKEISDQFGELTHEGPVKSRLTTNPVVQNPISEQATGWYSFAQGIDQSEIGTLLMKASIHCEVDQVGEAKKINTDLLRRAQHWGDKAAQFGCQRALALLYIKERDWPTAEKHAEQAMTLSAFQGTTGSFWPGSNEDKKRDYLAFALSFMKVKKWELAFTAMQQAVSVLVVSANSPSASVQYPTPCRVQYDSPPFLLANFQTRQEFYSSIATFVPYAFLLLARKHYALVSRDEYKKLTADLEGWLSTLTLTWPTPPWRKRADVDLERKMHDWLTTDLHLRGDWEVLSRPELDDLLHKYQYLLEERPTSETQLQNIESLTSTLEAAVAGYAAERELEIQKPIGMATTPEAPLLAAMGAPQQRAIAIGESMGFSRTQIDAAMRAAYSHPDRAIEYMLNGIPEHLRGDSFENIPVGTWKLAEVLEAARAYMLRVGGEYQVVPKALHFVVSWQAITQVVEERIEKRVVMNRDIHQSRAILAVLNSSYILNLNENANLGLEPEKFAKAIGLLLSGSELAISGDKKLLQSKNQSIADKVLELMIPGYKPFIVEEEQKLVTIESNPRKKDSIAINNSSTTDGVEQNAAVLQSIDVMTAMKAAFENEDETAMESAFPEAVRQIERTDVMAAMQTAFERGDKVAFKLAYEEAKRQVRRAGKVVAR